MELKSDNFKPNMEHRLLGRVEALVKVGLLHTAQIMQYI